MLGKSRVSCVMTLLRLFSWNEKNDMIYGWWRCRGLGGCSRADRLLTIAMQSKLRYVVCVCVPITHHHMTWSKEEKDYFCRVFSDCCCWASSSYCHCSKPSTVTVWFTNLIWWSFCHHHFAWKESLPPSRRSTRLRECGESCCLLTKHLVVSKYWIPISDTCYFESVIGLPLSSLAPIYCQLDCFASILCIVDTLDLGSAEPLASQNSCVRLWQMLWMSRLVSFKWEGLE